MRYIVKAIGWERFKLGLSLNDKDESVGKELFIERYKDIDLNARTKFKEANNELESFAFHLPKDAADTLTNALRMRGMRETNSSRSNLSAAMVKLIADLLEEDDV